VVVGVVSVVVVSGVVVVELELGVVSVAVCDEAEVVVVSVVVDELIRPPPTSPNAPATTSPATKSMASPSSSRAGFFPLCGVGLTGSLRPCARRSTSRQPYQPASPFAEPRSYSSSPQCRLLPPLALPPETPTRTLRRWARRAHGQRSRQCRTSVERAGEAPHAA